MKPNFSQPRGSSSNKKSTEDQFYKTAQQQQMSHSKNVKSQIDLKQRLYDTGFNQKTMPSVSRQLPKAQKIQQQQTQLQQRKSQKVLKANLASFKVRQQKQEHVHSQPQSYVLHNKMHLSSQQQQQSQIQQQQQQQTEFNIINEQQFDDFDQQLQKIEEQQQQQQQQQYNDISDLKDHKFVQQQLQNVKRAQTAKSRLASANRLGRNAQKSHVPHQTLKGNFFQPENLQPYSSLKKPSQQQQQQQQQKRQSSAFTSGQKMKPHYSQHTLQRPGTVMGSHQYTQSQTKIQNNTNNMRAATAYNSKFPQVQQQEFESPQKTKQQQSIQQRIQSGLTSGVDYKEHIHKTREVFGMPRAVSGKTLPPMSAFQSSQKNVKLQDLFGSNEFQEQGTLNLNEEDEMAILQQQQDIQDWDLQDEKTFFLGQEKERTQHLIDKISGKRFIDKRYIQSAQPKKHQRLKQIENEIIQESENLPQQQKQQHEIHRQQPDLNKEEEQEILNSLKKLREPSKLDKYIDLILKNITNVNEFIYLMRRKSDDPYDLQVVNFKTIQDAEKAKTLKEYYTISKKGLCHYVNGKPIEFIMLAYWLKERETYDQITQLKFFMNFRRWKTLKMWKRNVVKHKTSQYSRALEEKLFILNPILRTTLLDFRKITDDMSRNLRFISIGDESYSTQDSTFTLDQFKELQEKKRKEINDTIQDKSKNCREIVQYGFDQCLAELKKNQYMANNDEEIQPANNGNANNNNKKTQNFFRLKESAYENLGFSDNMNYEKRSELRKECSKFLRFSYLVDFLAMESLSSIFSNSVEQLEIKLSEQVKDLSEFIIFQDGQKGMPSQFEPLFQVQISPNFETIYSGLEIEPLMEFMPHPYGDHTAKQFNPLYHLKLKQKKEKKQEADGPKKIQQQQEDSESEWEDDIPNEETIYDREVVPNITLKWLKVAPDRTAFFNDMMKCIAEGVNSIQAFERWSRHDSMTKYVDVLEEWDDMVGDDWEHPDSNYLNPSEWLSTSPNELFEDIFRKLIDKAFDRIDLYIHNNFGECLTAYWENNQLDFSIYENELLLNPGPSFQFSIEKLKIWEELFKEKIPLTADLGLIKVDTLQLRDKIKGQPEEMLQKFKEFVPPMLERRNKEVQAWLNQSINAIKSTGLNIDEFVERSNQLEIISKTKSKQYQKFTNIVEILNIMEIQKFEFKSKAEKQLKTEIQQESFQMQKRLEQLILSAEESADRYLDKYAKEVSNFLIPALEKESRELDNFIQDKKFIEDSHETDVVIQELAELQKQIKILNDKSSLYNKYEQTLKLPMTRWEDLEETNIDLNLRFSMWNSLKEWSQLTSNWIDGKFTDIDVALIKSKGEIYTKIVQKCVKRLPPNPVLDKLKNLVYDFKDTMPVVVALRNPELKDYHWKEIKQIIGKDFEIDDEFTLRKLIDLDVVAHVQDIQEISTQATQEAVLEKSYKSQLEIWEELTFVVSSYSRGKDNRRAEAFLLDEIDELFSALDDLLANVNNILGSRYLKKIREDVDKLQKRILYCQETLDNWLAVQKNWIYFDNIFASNDIRQKLPTESQAFDQVDKFFKKQMNLAKKYAHIFRYTQKGDIKKEWIKSKETFSNIQKSLDNLLEDKRSIFPRFYFLSNDELLEILAKSQDREAIQKNIKKCFDGIQKLVYHKEAANSITGMESPEGEIVLFQKAVAMRGEVEQWLLTVQDQMKETMIKKMKQGKNDYDADNQERHQWVMKPHPAQVITTVAQMMWCACTEAFIQQLDKVPSSLEDWAGINYQQLEELTKLITQKGLDSVKHKAIVALITQDVHARDIVDSLYFQDVENISSFLWQKQLRYYWDDDSDYGGIVVKQVNALIKYGYEYLGAMSRLVITQLTDRCWMTITGALNIKLGAAPAGPAGTGKTESTKDLGKGLGMLCVVFNCSDQIEYKMMGRLFAGLSEQGAWACLDEFNRIDIEVLSVIAQQLLTIRQALVRGDQQFLFVDKEIALKAEGYGVFITMNPGYAGRTELPDNLKVLFRPVSMMIPDYGLIAEIMLFAEGFENASSLSKKMVQLYKLSSEQLSQQDHYDFGMRAVKSVLVMAGAIKRKNPDQNEDSILIRAMIDSNVPKFLKDDLPLFNALIQDLFPKLEIRQPDYGEIQQQIKESMQQLNLQYVQELQTKVLQLFETFNVRFGVMLVGETTSGKTTCFQILQHTMTELFKQKSQDPRMQEVLTHIINPKCITMGELYGEVNPFTQEWNDGLASNIMREAASDESEVRQWVVFDGPVDALWIENMNTVLDDNMMLCLANGQRIKLRHQMKMLFEVQDLKVASPATVSRCGMVYMVCEDLGWYPMVVSWIEEQFKDLQQEYVQYLKDIFKNVIDRALETLRDCMHEPIQSVDLQLVKSLCNLLECFLTEKFNFKPNQGRVEENKKFILYVFAFSFIWSVGATVSGNYHDHMNGLIRDLFQSVIFPNQDQVYGYFLDFQSGLNFQSWSEITEEFQYNKELPYFNLLVPTVDTCRYSFIMEQLLANQKNVYVTGPSGSGKSVIVQSLLKQVQDQRNIDFFNLIFSAQTSSLVTQASVEGFLNVITKSKLGAKSNHTNVVCIDDVNMPSVEEYGAQPPIELLRQLIDKGVFFDRKERFKKQILDTNLICVSAPPGGGRSSLTPRFTRHFNILCLPQPGQKILNKIFHSLLSGFLKELQFQDAIQQISQNIVNATIDTYSRIIEEKLPIPSKFHYTFNLRDVSKVFQGIMMTQPGIIHSDVLAIRLWIHEVSRVFHDRLINNEDKEWFYDLLMELLGRHFKHRFEKEQIFGEKKIMFSDILRLDFGKEYEEIMDVNKLHKVLDEKMDDYNTDYSASPMNLVFFNDCIEHILRISRVLKQPRGNAMLIGVGGSGKQSLTKLATYMLSYQTLSVQVTKGYGIDHFREFIQELMKETGIEGKNITFLFNDTQIINETFLEDINNILNSGEIPNLWNQELRGQVIDETRPYNAKLKRPEDPDTIYKTFVERVRNNLHIVLCMSPVGDSLRIRCRKFPSLVDCCALDWFSPWPAEALYNVAYRILKDDMAFPQAKENHDEMLQALATTCKDVHLSSTQQAKHFELQLKRKVYTTPKSYLDLIKQYQFSLQKKRAQLITQQRRLASGLQKLQEANVQVAELQITLTELKPKLEEQNKAVKKAITEVEKEAVIASEEESVVAEETERVMKQKDRIQLIADDAQFELNKCLPELQRAQAAVEKIDKSQLVALRTMQTPPPVVSMVFEAVCILFGMNKTDWQSAKTLLMDINKFIHNLLNFDKDNIPPKVLKKLNAVLAREEFDIPTIATKVSYAADMAMFCKSTKIYADVSEKVKPKREQVATLTKELDQANQQLQVKEAELKKVQDNVQRLRDETQNMLNEKEALEKNMELTEQRLTNAKKLILLTAEEKTRWEATIKILSGQIENLFGDVFLAAAEISYNGPFTGVYRQELVEKWNQQVTELKIPKSETYNIVKVLGEPMLIREWIIQGLPSDQVSQENSVYVQEGYRWPLLIDPQIQAIKWLKNMEKEHNVQILKMSNPKFINIMNLAIPNGYPVIIEDIDETIDPLLDPICSKAVYDAEGRKLIKFADKEIDYHKDFRIFLTTKKPNPNYLPEIFIKVTVINFTATFEGLEDQLLADVVKHEKPETEKQRDENVKNLAEFKKKIEESEKEILKLLAEANADTILDDVNLITTLEDSKQTAIMINQRLKESSEIEVIINETRNSYRKVSIRGSILFFVIKDLSLIDPMYQYSLQYIQKLFVASLTQAEESENHEERLDNLIDSITKNIFTNVTRGLFEKDKPIFSFLCATSINKEAGILKEDLWYLFLRGAPVFDKSKMPTNPDPEIISPLSWELAYYLDVNFEDTFQGLCQNIKNRIIKWTEFAQSEKPLEFALPEKWNDLPPFEKMLIVKIFRPEKITFAVQKYVGTYLGKFFLEFPTVSMAKVHQDSDNKTPIIFVLSQGADPTQQIVNFAKQQNMEEKLVPKSLGQGQGEIASQMIVLGKEKGNWVFLMNCHLSRTWMPSLELIVQQTMEEENVHPDYRLILTSMPNDYFPVSVLQNGIKLTTEPPRGFKANLKRSWDSIDQDFLQASTEQKKNALHKIVWGLTYFHAIIQVRRKFGPLGWNIRYEFNDSDLETSTQVLKMLLEDQEQIPWDSMLFVAGHINYGGRVTDDWDRICLMTNLKRLLVPEILKEQYQFSESPLYVVPPISNIDTYKEFIQNLPIDDEPSVFGMHENANIAFQVQESEKVLHTILSIQTKVTTSSSGKSQDQIVTELVESLLESLPKCLQKQDGNKELFEENEQGLIPSLSTVLLQEMVRFQRLLDTIQTTLQNLQKAIAGIMVMSQELDATYNSLINNQVPKLWEKVAYPSLKPLTSWIQDLKLKVAFMNKWMQEGNPVCYWLSGFFFPQGFLTGVLQTYARKMEIPIDELQFNFRILDQYQEEVTFRPPDGVQIYGLYVEGASWNTKKKTITDQEPGKMTTYMPVIYFNPTKEYKKSEDSYRCPVYKTSVRAGTLSTTGHSTNFVLPVDIPTLEQTPEYWTLRGAALICQLNE